MPEGDTVYLTAKRLRTALAGRVLLRGQLRHPRLAEHDLAGLKVIDVRSFGKHLFIRFSDDRSLHSHLKMEGAWHLYPPGSRWRRPAHQARAVLENGSQVAVGFAIHDLALLPTEEEERLIGHLGPDLLDPVWGEPHLERVVAGLTDHADEELGVALLDQRIMAGVGNLYKSELCFLLGISPFSPVRETPAVKIVTLARRLLLLNADRPEQCTTGDLRPGWRHWVYERAGKPCRRCGTAILRLDQGSGLRVRGSYLCPRCQRSRQSEQN
jgi:endonuclease-8